MDDIIVRRASRSLQTRMCLEIKIEIVNRGNTPIDNGPWSRVSKPVCLVRLCWVEPGVMPLPDNDYCDFGSVVPKTCASRTNQRQFLLDHRVELP